MSRMIRGSLLIAVGMTLLTAPGCQLVKVQDIEGKAIFGATVSTGEVGKESIPDGYSMWPFGHAWIFRSANEDPQVKEYLIVNKEDYLPWRQLRSDAGQIVVTLKKVNPTPAPAPAPDEHAETP